MYYIKGWFLSSKFQAILQMGSPGKKVLLTSNGDEISQNLAFHLAQRGCRFTLKLVESLEMCNTLCVSAMH